MIDFNFIKEKINPYWLFKDREIASLIEKKSFKAYKDPEKNQYRIFYKGKTYTLINFVMNLLKTPVKETNKIINDLYEKYYSEMENKELDKKLIRKPEKIKKRNTLKDKNGLDLLVHSYTLMHPGPILEKLGYRLSKNKSSKFSLVFKKRPGIIEERGEFVLFRRLPNRQYIYVNPRTDGDKGNIINFLQKRLAKLQNKNKINRIDIIKFMEKEVKPEYKEKMKNGIYKHLKPKPSKYVLKNLLKEHKIIENLLKRYSELKEDNYLTKYRGFNFEFLKYFFDQIKENEYKNIVYTTKVFIPEKNDFIYGSLNFKINKIANPEFILKNVAIGLTQGISIMIPTNSNNNPKHLILAESFLDSLSYFLINHLDKNGKLKKDFNESLKNYIFTGTEGAIDKNKLNYLKQLIKKYEKSLKNINILLDKDKYGEKFKEELENFFKNNNFSSDIKINFYTADNFLEKDNQDEIIKDFNDLLLHKKGSKSITQIEEEQYQKKKGNYAD